MADADDPNDPSFPFPYVVPLDPNLGRRVDVYFIVRVLLGRGGMGAAYLAEHEALAHVRCVIKVILAEIARQPLAIARFKTETQAVSLLSAHDNVVKLQNFGVLDDGQLYMRFEFVDGKPLDRHVKKRGGRLPLREALYLLFQVMDVMQFAHDHGVVHRDLKPDNLLVEFNPPGWHLDVRVKVLDFGIAKVVANGETASGFSMGTPKYMAPEQVGNAAGATGAADVFSVALVLYRVVTGTLPWGEPESDAMIYHKQRTEAPAWPSEDVLPRAVVKVLSSCLSLNPDDRPGMREMAIDLACAVPTEGRKESGTEILKKVVSRWVESSPPDVQTLPHPVPPSPDDILPRPSASIPQATPTAQSTPAVPVTSSAPLADVTMHERPRAADARMASVFAAATMTTEPPSPSPPPMAEAPVPPTPRRPASQLLAQLRTGLGSQQFAAQRAPVEGRTAPVSVAAEIEAKLAAGTPGPHPYAHAELPLVVVSTTQIPGLMPLPAAPEARPPRPPEPAPFIVLPEVPRPRFASSSRVKLALVGAAVTAFALAGVVAAFARHGSHAVVPGDRAGTSGADPEAPRVAAAETDPDRSKVAAPTPDRRADDRDDATIAAPAPATTPEKVRVRPSPESESGTPSERAHPGVAASLEVSASASAQAAGVSSTPTAVPGKPSGAAPSNARPASALRAADQAAPDEAAPGARLGASARRPAPTPSNAADQVPAPSRAPAPRATADAASEVTLIIRVKGFAAVSIDGDEPSASPRRKRVRVGAHHVVMTGYPDGSDEKKTKEFDVSVPAGHDETIIHKAW